MLKRIDLALLIGVAASLLLTSLGAFARDCGDIRANVVRLHILANSDSEEDQALKLAVRDAILEETAELFAAPADKGQAEAAASAHLEEIAAAAREEVVRQGYDYEVSARIVNRYFETRQYEDFTMPAGRYDAVQVEIGAGAGKNWWCVMFPPLCIPAASAHDETPLEEQIKELGQPLRYKPAFAVVEALESLRERFQGEAEKTRVDADKSDDKRT